MPILALLSYGLVFALLAALAWRDLCDYLLPDVLNAALAITFLSFHIANDWELLSPADSLSGALTGGGFMLTFYLMANLFYKKDSIGLGDVKLMTAAGLGLGFPNIILAISLGAFIGLGHGLLLGHFQNKKRGKTMPLAQINVPAGLGLTAGIAIVMLSQFGFFWMDRT